MKNSLENASKDLEKLKKAAKSTTGREREKYLQGIDNLERYIEKLKSKVR